MLMIRSERHVSLFAAWRSSVMSVMSALIPSVYPRSAALAWRWKGCRKQAILDPHTCIQVVLLFVLAMHVARASSQECVAPACDRFGGPRIR